MVEAQIAFTCAIKIALSEQRSEVVASFLYGFEIAFGYPVTCQHERSGLKHFPKFSNLMNIIFRHLSYEIPSALSGANEPFAEQLGQSLPQGSSAHLKFCCPILFPEPFIWHQFKDQNAAP